MFNYFKTKSKNLSKTIDHSEHGTIKLRKIKGSKRLAIRISPLKGISVTVPYSYSWQQAEEFINSRREWIVTATKETANIEAQRTIFKPGIGFNTSERSLEWINSDCIKIQTRLGKNKIYIYYNEKKSLEDNETQDTIRQAIERALRSEARTHLLPLASNYAIQYGIKLGKLSLRTSRTRWGSCSSKNDISLNIHLLRLPERLMHYVVLHELAHTQEHNHSKAFWSLLDRFCIAALACGAKELDKELKDFSPHLY